MELKDKAHPCYELVRSLNLCGPLPESTKPKDTSPPRLSVGLRVCLFGLRWLVSLGSACLGAFNLLMVGTLPELSILPPTVPFSLRLPFAIALMTPYSIVSILVARDMLRSESPLVVAVMIAIGCAGMLCFSLGIPQGSMRLIFFYMLTGIVVYWLLHAAAALLSTRVCKRERKQSRVALLYDRILGLSGSHFVLKVFTLQMFTTVTQAWSKLPQLGKLVWMQGSEWFVARALASVTPFFFWLFFFALLVNSVYPGKEEPRGCACVRHKSSGPLALRSPHPSAAVLLRSESRSLQRDAAAAVDVA